MKVLGCITVSILYRKQEKQLDLLVVCGDGPTLLGRDWLAQLQLDWKQLNRVHSSFNPGLQHVLERHLDMF